MRTCKVSVDLEKSCYIDELVGCSIYRSKNYVIFQYYHSAEEYCKDKEMIQFVDVKGRIKFGYDSTSHKYPF